MQQVVVDFGTVSLFGASLPLRIHGYGLMLVLGFLTAVFIARWRAKRAGEAPDMITHLGLLALIGGVLGARLAYVVKYWDRFINGSSNIFELLNVTSGGLIYYGGVVLATALVLVYLLAKRLPVRRYLDLLAVSLMVGLAFGRAGCLLNGCCFGGKCAGEWALGTTFPMFSKPLLKLDGRDNPFSHGTEGPSPAYTEQFHKDLLHPDDRLVSSGAFTYVLPPRYLHGRLDNDQLAETFEPVAVRKKFHALAGRDGLISESEWERGLAERTGLLLGSENFADAIRFDADRNRLLDFEEVSQYFAWRRDRLLERFDGDGDGALAGKERTAANAFLQADLFALASAGRSLPVKPAQALGIVNALLLAGILLGFSRLRNREGQTFALMVILYPITRFVLESIRGDNPHSIMNFVFTHNQYTSMVMVALGVILWMALGRMPASAGPTWAQRLAESHSGKAGATRPPRKAGRTRRGRS